MMRLRHQPPSALLDRAELGVRVALVLSNVLAGRFALARISGRGMAGADARKLARVAAASNELAAAVSAVLAETSPQLAADATVMAEETSRREMAVPWSQSAPTRHLSLVDKREHENSDRASVSRSGS